MASRQTSFAQIVSDLETQFLSAFPRTPTREQQSLSDRIRRALSWMKRAASVSQEDRPPRFVDLWIALNALYGRRYYGKESSRNEYKDFREFISLVTAFNEGRDVLGVWMGKRHVQGRVRHLVENQYLYVEFWEENIPGYKEELRDQSERLESALRNTTAKVFCACMFDRLIVLRNQIIHGSASADTRRNKDALVPGILVLEELLPVLVKLLIEHGRGRPWPDIPYPAIHTALHPVSD